MCHEGPCVAAAGWRVVLVSERLLRSSPDGHGTQTTSSKAARSARTEQQQSRPRRSEPRGPPPARHAARRAPAAACTREVVSARAVMSVHMFEKPSAPGSFALFFYPSKRHCLTAIARRGALTATGCGHAAGRSKSDVCDCGWRDGSGSRLRRSACAEGVPWARGAVRTIIYCTR